MSGSKPISPRSDEAVEFLQRWREGGPWVLTSIDPDKKGISTQTFTEPAKALKWLEECNGVRNIYFHVNPTLVEMSKKAERTDIKELAWLHVDIDPRAGEDIAEERARALRLLQNYRVPPTVILDSGGGYQGFWKLEEPVPINGELPAAEDAKRYNIQLELDFGADNCHNIDRIMRLPGTVNIPDARKKKKGRVPALASLVLFDDTRVYNIDKFTKAPEVQTGEDLGFSGTMVNISGNIARLTDVEDLPDTVPGRIKVIIVQGEDPDEPNRYSSRSETLFAVCTALVRAGVDDTTIYSVITDPAFGISASVLDKKNSEKYAVRQIERAREEAIHPKLRELNEKHAVIGDMGGKCRVVSEVFDPAMKRMRISRQSFDDFRNRYLHIPIEVGNDSNGKPTFKKLGQWWLENPNHRHFETMCFAPGQHVEGAYNLWKGFGCDARPGQCEKLLNHIRANICSGNEDYHNYLMGWLARAVQHPDTPGEVAVVLRGRMGTGKGLFARTVGSLFGRHFLQVTDPKHLVGSFNSHLRDCVLLFADEAFYAGDKKHESILKALITEPFVQFEAKGVDAEMGPNYSHIIMASNNSWVVPAGADERRYFVLDVGDDKMQDKDYFRALQDEINNGGREAFLHVLLSMDIKDFEVRNVPKTEALHEQKLLSMGPEEEWFYSKLQDGRLLSRHERWEPGVEKDEFYDDFYSYMQKLGQYRRATKTSLGRFLERVCPSGYPQTRQRYVERQEDVGNGFTVTKKYRPYFYDFPALAECRATWDKKMGGVSKWPEISNDDAQESMPSRHEPPF